MPSLQKTNLAAPTVASVGNPSTGVDTGPAQAVQAIGGAVRDFAVKKRQENLLEDLDVFADEVEAAKFGEELTRASDRFERIKKARDQGRLDDNMVRIEAESILKSSIESMPAFAPELRRFAAQHLGYDPTGAELRSKLDIPAPAAEDPLMKEARSIAMASKAKFEDVYSIIGQAALRKRELELIEAQAAIGAAGAKEIFAATLQTSRDRKADLMLDVLGMVQSGGVRDEAEIQSMVTGMINTHKSDFIGSVTRSGISLDPQDLSAYLSTIDADWEGIKQMIEEGSFEEIVAQNVKELTNAMTIKSWDVFGDMSLVNLGMGQEGVKNMFTIANKPPEQLATLRAVNPKLDRIITQLGDSRLAAVEGYKIVMGVTPSFSSIQAGNGLVGTGEQGPQLTPEQRQELGDVALQELTTNNNLSDDEKTRRAQYAITAMAGRRWKILGTFMQPGARPNATDREVDRVVENFEAEYEPLLARIAAGMADKPGLKVKISDSNKLYFDQAGHAATGEMHGDLKRLRSFINGANNGWAKDFEVEAAAMPHYAVVRINELVRKSQEESVSVEEAISQFEKDPSQENLDQLRKVAPDVIDAALSAIPTGGIGNDNQ